MTKERGQFTVEESPLTVQVSVSRAGTPCARVGARAAVALSLVLTAAGCASLAPDRGALATGANAGANWSPETPIGPWPGDGWWKAYGDAQLNGLIDEALDKSPTMRMARARVERARATIAETRSGLFPALQGLGTATETKQSYNTGIPPMFVPHGYNDFGQATLNLNYNFDLWGKTRSSLAAATSEARAARADMAAARLTLSTAVAGAYADLSRLYGERDVAERSVRSRQETLDLVARRVANGIDTQGELNQAKAGVPSAKADLAAIDEDIGLARNALSALLGEGPQRGLSIARPGKAALQPFTLPDKLGAHLVGRRPDVVAARWRAEAAATRVGAARAAFYPDVNIMAFGGFEALYLRRLFASDSAIGQVGPAVSLPIFEGGRLRGELRGAKADYASAVATYDAAVVQSLHEAADAATSRRVLTERLSQTREALAGQEEAYRIAKLRYDGGLANYQTVLTAEDRVLAGRRAVVDLEARAFSLDIQLIKALGGGFTDAA